MCVCVGGGGQGLRLQGAGSNISRRGPIIPGGGGQLLIPMEIYRTRDFPVGSGLPPHTRIRA